MSYPVGLTNFAKLGMACHGLCREGIGLLGTALLCMSGLETFLWSLFVFAVVDASLQGTWHSFS